MREDLFADMLRAIPSEDPNRAGLHETPRRMADAWRFWLSGYSQDPASVLKTFEDGAESADEMIFQRNIPFFSHCEHHLAPFFGMISIAYIPNKRIVGLSKLSRIVEIFSRRLQVQERLTSDIATTLMDNLHPIGVGVVIHARHLCQESRGIQKVQTITTTSALRGVIKDNKEARAEFFTFVGNATITKL